MAAIIASSKTESVDEWAALFVATPDGMQRRCLVPCYKNVYEVQAGRS